jgi:hypothetical protein
LEVVLGGGTLHHGNRDVFERVAARVTAVAPRANVTVLDVSPVYGALVEAFRLAGVVRDGSVDLRELKLLRNALAR